MRPWRFSAWRGFGNRKTYGIEACNGTRNDDVPGDVNRCNGLARLGHYGARMNVKPGDSARIVDSRTPNDGAVVFVLRSDPEASASYGFQWWIVCGKDLAGYVDAPWPTSVTGLVTMPDQCLQRIDPGASSHDTREPIEQLEPIARETACPTT